MELLRPMLAVAGAVSAERSDEYAFEIKWDGVRLVTYVEGSRVRAFTRNDRCHLPGSGATDGLARRPTRCAGRRGRGVQQRGVVHFGTLQHRMHIADPAVVQRLMATVPVTYVVFDLLALDDQPLINEPYEHRRATLMELGLAAPQVLVPPTIDGDADHALEVSAHMRAEGIIAKRHGSQYYPGRRSPDWIKIKHERMQEVVIGGWRPGSGNRLGMIGSLLIGIPSPDGLRYVGRVGTGFTDTALRHLAKQLAPLARDTPPFLPPVPREVTRDAHWVQPS